MLTVVRVGFYARQVPATSPTISKDAGYTHHPHLAKTASIVNDL